MPSVCRPKVVIEANQTAKGEEDRFVARLLNGKTSAVGRSPQSAFSAFRAKAILHGFRGGEHNFHLVFPPPLSTQE